MSHSCARPCHRARSGRAAFARRVLAGGALLVVAACNREHTPAVGNGGAAAEPSARRLDDPSAFDLTLSERGAVLGWVEASSSELHIARFDAQGEALASSVQKLAQPAALDLVLADTSAGLSAVWRSEGTARGVWLEPSGAVQWLDLGAAWAAPEAGRGNLALVQRGASALALVRGPSEPCGDGSDESCFGFRFYQLSGRGAFETGLGLRVPVPCDARAALLISARAPAQPGAGEPRFQYAVCTRSESAPVLTVFSIEPDRSYAAAQKLFSDCTPLGAGNFAGQSLFVAECQGARRVARLRSADAPVEIVNLDVRGLLCSARGARLRLGSEWLELSEPSDRLELLLDASLSPPGSRAVWTGSALLVARLDAGRLVLDRHACADSGLRQLPSPLD
jgi:hypothetical protein